VLASSSQEDVAEVVFFLLGALSIVEIMDARREKTWESRPGKAVPRTST
jgi:hypothetical protein